MPRDDLTHQLANCLDRIMHAIYKEFGPDLGGNDCSPRMTAARALAEYSRRYPGRLPTQGAQS